MLVNLSVVGNSLSELAEGNDFLVLEDVVEELLSAAQSHALDGHGGLVCQLVVHLQV